MIPPSIIAFDALKVPITLRITRQGNTIRAEYSMDDGKPFKAAVAPVTFDPPLSQTLYTGLGVTAGDRSQIVQATFSLPEIKEL